MTTIIITGYYHQQAENRARTGQELPSTPCTPRPLRSSSSDPASRSLAPRTTTCSSRWVQKSRISLSLSLPSRMRIGERAKPSISREISEACVSRFSNAFPFLRSHCNVRLAPRCYGPRIHAYEYKWLESHWRDRKGRTES